MYIDERAPREGLFEEDIGNGRWAFGRDHHFDLFGQCRTGSVDVIGNVACVREA